MKNKTIALILAAGGGLLLYKATRKPNAQDTITTYLAAQGTEGQAFTSNTLGSNYATEQQAMIAEQNAGLFD